MGSFGEWHRSTWLLLLPLSAPWHRLPFPSCGSQLAWEFLREFPVWGSTVKKNVLSVTRVHGNATKHQASPPVPVRGSLPAAAPSPHEKLHSQPVSMGSSPLASAGDSHSLKTTHRPQQQLQPGTEEKQYVQVRNRTFTTDFSEETLCTGHVTHGHEPVALKHA